MGVKKDVTARQTAHGVKDQLAEYWIKILLERAHVEHQRRITNATTADPRLKNLRGDKRAEVVLTIKKEIQNELLDWLVMQPPERYSQLPLDSCRSYSIRTSCDTE